MLLILTNVTLLFIFRKNYQEALEYFNKTINLNPNNELAWLNKGSILLRLNLTEQALECFNKSIDINKQLIEAYDGKCEALTQLNRNEEAKICYKRLLDIKKFI